MKRPLLVLTCCLAALTLAASSTPAQAETEAHSAAANSTPEPLQTEGACSAWAWCWDSTQVSCSGISSCTSKDDSCPSYTGYVVCDGQYSHCLPCPQPCSASGRSCQDDDDCLPPQAGDPYWCDFCHCSRGDRVCICPE